MPREQRLGAGGSLKPLRMERWLAGRGLARIVTTGTSLEGHLLAIYKVEFLL